VSWFFTFQAISGECKNRALRWLLWTSIQKIDMYGMIKLTSLPKSVRCEYNQLGSFYSYSFSNAPISTKERFNSCCLCSSRSSNVHLSAFKCSHCLTRNLTLRLLPNTFSADHRCVFTAFHRYTNFPSPKR
jgi:hypothetical protein